MLDAHAPWTVWRAAKALLQLCEQEGDATARHLVAAPTVQATRARMRVDAPLRPRPLRARVDALRLRRLAAPDVVHLWWEGSCCGLLASAFSSVARTATLWAAPSSERRAQALARWATGGAVAAGESIAPHWPLTGLRCAQPPALLEPLSPEAMQRLRSQWGASSERIAVVGLAGEPAAAQDALRFAAVIGALALLGVRTAGVAPAEARNVAAGARLLSELGGDAALLTVADDSGAWLASCDAALHAGQDAASAQAALDAGIPVVASAAWGAAAPSCVVASSESPLILAGALQQALAHGPLQPVSQREAQQRLRRWRNTHETLWRSAVQR